MMIKFPKTPKVMINAIPIIANSGGCVPMKYVLRVASRYRLSLEVIASDFYR